MSIKLSMSELYMQILKSKKALCADSEIKAGALCADNEIKAGALSADSES
jgi:hypothetical protein